MNRTMWSTIPCQQPAMPVEALWVRFVYQKPSRSLAFRHSRLKLPYIAFWKHAAPAVRYTGATFQKALQPPRNMVHGYKPLSPISLNHMLPVLRTARIPRNTLWCCPVAWRCGQDDPPRSWRTPSRTPAWPISMRGRGGLRANPTGLHMAAIPNMTWVGMHLRRGQETFDAFDIPSEFLGPPFMMVGHTTGNMTASTACTMPIICGADYGPTMAPR